MVAYDSNYRPRLWDSSKAARDWSQRAMAVATIGLPTGDDERLMQGTQDHDAAIAERWLAAGCQEVAVKGGAAGCTLASLSQAPIHSPCIPVTIVDSSGAGDAFNAAYLAAKLTGDAPQSAAAQAHRLAAWVIGRHGALPPPDSGAPYAGISRTARTDQSFSSPRAATATSGAVL
jgi:2-dehydro-3-deoxygluconokinase